MAHIIVVVEITRRPTISWRILIRQLIVGPATTLYRHECRYNPVAGMIEAAAHELIPLELVLRRRHNHAVTGGTTFIAPQ